MSKKDEKYKNLANKILDEIGGKANISSVTHCMTRLRFNLKDESIPNDDNIKSINGVLGVNRSGGQYQIVIGQTVPKVYDALIAISGLTKNAPIDENLDKDLTKKEPFSWKKLGSATLNKLARSLTPLIPILVGASMFKMFVAIFGPTMLNWLSTSSDTYKLFTLVGDAGFYFFPIFLGYTASKQFHTSPMISMLLGAILLDPNLTSIVKAGKAFSVYGIPMKLVSYSSTVIPIILAVWVMSYIEPLVKKIVPDSLSVVLTPTVTLLVMLPITLTVVGPAGAFLGQYVSDGILAFSKSGGIWSILGIAIIGALWELLVMTGMHLILISTMMMIFATAGHENFISIGGLVASMSVAGMCIGTALALHNRDEKVLAWGYFVACFIGGVTEPALYGLAIRYKRPFIGMMLGGFAGGLYAGIVHLDAYSLVPVANFLGLSACIGGTTANFINAIISAGITIVVAAIATYIIGVEPKTGNSKESSKNLKLVEA